MLMEVETNYFPILIPSFPGDSQALLRIITASYGATNRDEVIEDLESDHFRNYKTDHRRVDEAVSYFDSCTYEGHDSCSICLENFVSPVITSCKHVFCQDCLEKVIKSKNMKNVPCPMCRTPLLKKTKLQKNNDNLLQ